ncbi:hypothetical protein KKC88_00040 [Patescibacteria group bacterium]|nr:hypothetical protein [Patescibacteria group bacterium]MBU1673023.1 hypothetical protein [Patescibacteria group bacterium]MBU1963292.1 hypothetical protein [Patescibacteria group bacterium]
MSPDGIENKPRLFEGHEQGRRGPETQSPQERTEYHPTQAAIRDMRDFFDFAETPAIQNELDRGRSLSDAIYDRFYSEDYRGQKYNENDPRYQNLARSYNRTMSQTEDWCRQMQDWSNQQGNETGFVVQENQLQNDWMYIRTNGGLDSKQPIGRMYLNLKPGAAPDFYARAADEIFKAGVGADLKMPREANIDDFNRPDKVVIYFNEADQGKLLELIRSYYQEKPQAFDEGTPRFTAELADQQGGKMTGVGFAEQPLDHSKSFGDIRSNILADMYATAQAQGISMHEKEFHPAAQFIVACENHRVDPENPAFNIGIDGTNRFEAMRSQRPE